jgi:hypothetical protein
MCRSRRSISWRERFRTNPSWGASREYFAENRRVFCFPDEIEDMMADFLRINFVQLGRSLTHGILQPLVLALVQDLVGEQSLDDSFLNFKSSRHFLTRFSKRVGLSFRRAGLARRCAVDNGEYMHFPGQLTAAYHRYPPHLIVNFDESNWYLVMAGEETVAERGAQSMHHYVAGDPKANSPFFGRITAESQKLPLILIAKGRTRPCHKQFDHHPHHQFEIWHSPSGWPTEPFPLDYLDWLQTQMPPEPLCLLLDQFGTNTTGLVTTKAEALGIEMIWIPKGATGRYQPLDRRTFGARKAKGKANWRPQFAEHYGMGCTRERAAELRLQSWDELSDSRVAAG